MSVYDLGQTPDGTLYIAMEFIDGPSLKTLIQAGRAIPPMHTIAILRQVASALATAHRHNIIHRDLKPHNIMLATGPDGAEVVKLVDFGIAKTFDESTQLTSTGSALGTPYYMSPEQIEGRTVDPRADLYALGIILYEMLVGEVPFADQSTPAVLVKQLKERPVRPSLKNAAVPAALETISLRCLEKDPDQRFQTADEFAAALNDAAATMSDAAGMATMPMARPAAAGPAASEATLVSPARAPFDSREPALAQGRPPATPTAPPPAAPVQAGQPSKDTRPTVNVPQMQPAVAAVPSQPPAKKSSLMPLVAIAAVLMLIAGGALWYSGRQAPPTGSTTAAATPTEPPKTVPAMATQQTEPPAANPAPVALAANAAALPPPPNPAARSGSEPAAVAAATKEAVTAKPSPPTAAPAPVKAGTAAVVTASRTTAAPAPGTAAPGAAPAAAARESQPAPTIKSGSGAEQ